MPTGRHVRDFEHRRVELHDLIETFNANVEKLNARMFTYLDYAVIGDK